MDGTNIQANKNYEIFLAASAAVLMIFAAVFPRALTVLPGIVSLGLFFVCWRANTARPAMIRPAFIYMFVLLAMMAVTTFWAVDPHMALDRTLKTLPVLLTSALLLSVAQASDGNIFRRWFPVVLLSTFGLCIIELYMHGIFYHLAHAQPIAAEYDNLFYLNRANAIMILMLPVAVTCVRMDNLGRETKRALLGMLALGAAAILYQTDSQSSQLAFAIAVVLYFFFPTKIKSAWVALWAVLVAVIFASPWIAQEIFKPMVAMASDSTLLQRGYATNRLEIWDFVARRALERPFYGFGVEATRAIKDFDSAVLYNLSNTALHPHNFALQLWIEMGVWGPVFAAVFFGAIMKTISRFEPLYARTSLATLFAAISIASTGYGLWQAMWLASYGMAAAFTILAIPKDGRV